MITSIVLPLAAIGLKQWICGIIAIGVLAVAAIPMIDVIKQSSVKKGALLILCLLMVAVAVYAAMNWIIPDNAFVNAAAEKVENFGTDALNQTA